MSLDRNDYKILLERSDSAPDFIQRTHNFSPFNPNANDADLGTAKRIDTRIVQALFSGPSLAAQTKRVFDRISLTLFTNNRTGKRSKKRKRKRKQTKKRRKKKYRVKN